MDWKKEFHTEQGVYHKAEIDSSFEELYLEIREKEKRLLADETVLQLPHINAEHEHHSEWKKRADTLERFAKFLKQHHFNTALEIGCGNGWFSNFLANHTENCIGQDINVKELQQAVRVFNRSNLDFVCTDNILELARSIKPDLVVFNASLQYFNPEEQLLQALMETLDERAQIHILDSPVYTSHQEALSAQSRSAAYYKNKEVAELSNFYFHYTKEHINGEWLYRPPGRLKRLLRPDSSPFPWLRLTSKHRIHA